MRWLLILALVAPLGAQVSPPHERVADKPFVALTVAQFASAAFDIESTQRCIRSGACKEGNPLMGQTRAQEYAVAFGGEALVTVLAYKLKKHGHAAWKIAPIFDVGLHGVLGGMNFRF